MQYQIISRQIRIDDPVVLIVQKALLRSRVNNKCNVLLNDVFLCQLGSGIIVMEPRCLRDQRNQQHLPLQRKSDTKQRRKALCCGEREEVQNSSPFGCHRFFPFCQYLLQIRVICAALLTVQAILEPIC